MQLLSIVNSLETGQNHFHCMPTAPYAGMGGLRMNVERWLTHIFRAFEKLMAAVLIPERDQDAGGRGSGGKKGWMVRASGLSNTGQV